MSSTDYISSDRPIDDRSQDRLDRRRFAERIATVLSRWQDRESLVIGLYGRWGTGKTSIINMVVDALKKGGTGQAAPILRFNPWQATTETHLVEGFFRELRITVGREKPGNARFAQQLQRYSERVAAVHDVVGALKDVLPTTIDSGLFVAILGLLLRHHWWGLIALSVGLVVVVAAGVLSFSERLLRATSRLLPGHSKMALDEQKSELQESFRSLERPIIVILDDVDRLTTNELPALMRLIKANADFPNLIYILLCQREVVERGLDGVWPDNGKAFLEKIVQLPIDVPEPPSLRIHKLLTDELDKILAGPPMQRFDSRRWEDVYINGVRHYFHSLRDVRRFLAGFAFHVEGFLSGQTFEVNPVDLIALETLRIFESEVYYALRRDIGWFVPGTRRLLHSEKRKQEQQGAVNAVLALAMAERRNQIRKILTALFPEAGEALGGSNSEPQEEWEREGRICAEAYTQRYFALEIGSGEVSQVTLNTIMQADDRNALVGLFWDLQQRDLFEDMLDRLEPYKQRIPIAQAKIFLTSLFDVADSLPIGRMRSFYLTSAQTAMRIVHWYLKQEQDRKTRARILEAAIRDTTGLFLPCLVIGSETRRKEDRDPENYLLDEGDATQLADLCLAKVRRAAIDGSLLRQTNLAMILYRWREWSSADEPREWVSGAIQSKEGASRVLSALTKSVYINGREHRKVELPELREFADTKQLKLILDTVDRTQANGATQRDLRAFEAAMRREQTGKSDDDDEGIPVE